MPKQTIENVSSAQDLDGKIPEQYKMLDKLSDEQKETATKMYPAFENALEDITKYATNFDHIISHGKACGERATEIWMANKNWGQHIDSYDYRKQPDAPWEADERTEFGVESNLQFAGDWYLRAQIHAARHEDAIKKAIDANDGQMPSSYKQPKSEWWFSWLWK